MPKDLALIVDRTDDLQGFQIIRARVAERTVEFGTLRPLRHGKPIEGELVSLRPRKDAPFVYDVKTELPDTRRPTSDGPAQVASPEYRKGWDAIWGGGSPATGGARPN